MLSWPFPQNRLIGWIRHALLVQPSKSNSSNWKILFVLDSYEYLERLEGKIRDGIFFYVNMFKNTSVLRRFWTLALISKVLFKMCLRTFSCWVHWMQINVKLGFFSFVSGKKTCCWEKNLEKAKVYSMLIRELRVT